MLVLSRAFDWRIMALTNSGFDGTVNEAEFARMWAIGGVDGVESTAAWAVTAGTGRQVSVAAQNGYAFAKGVLSKDGSSAILKNLSTPTNGQWFLIVRHIAWATNTVTIEALAHTTTSTTVPTVAPGTYPTMDANPGVLYDQPLAWAWVNSVNTTVTLFDLRTLPIASRLAAYDLNDFVNVADFDALPSAGLNEGRRVNVDEGNVTMIAQDGVWVQQGASTFASTGARDTAYAKASAAYRLARTMAVDTSTGASSRFDGTNWLLWESDWITWATAPTSFTVGTGGSAAQVQRYKYIGGRIWFEYRLVLGTTGASVSTNPTLNLPINVALLAPGGQVASGDGVVYDVSAGSTPAYTKALVLSATTVRISSYTGAIASISATTPMTWAAGDILAGGFWADA